MTHDSPGRDDDEQPSRPAEPIPPPPPGPMPAAPGDTPRYEPLSGRARAIVVTLAVLMALDLFAVGSGLLELRLLDRIAAGEPVTDAEATNNDDRQAIVGLLQFGVYLVAIVLFIRWLHRAYRNVDAIAPQERRHGTGWAIGGWFVPILSLWRPKQIVNDVWRAGAPPDRPDDRDPGGLLIVWWLAYLLTGTLGQIAFLRSDDAAGDASLDELRSATIAYLVADGFDVLAALLAILAVRATTRRMESKAAGARASVAAPWSTPQTH